MGENVDQSTGDVERRNRAPRFGAFKVRQPSESCWPWGLNGKQSRWVLHGYCDSKSDSNRPLKNTAEGYCRLLL